MLNRWSLFWKNAVEPWLVASHQIASREAALIASQAAAESLNRTRAIKFSWIVKNAVGEATTVLLVADATIDGARREIATATGIPAPFQRLYFAHDSDGSTKRPGSTLLSTLVASSFEIVLLVATKCETCPRVALDWACSECGKSHCGFCSDTCEHCSKVHCFECIDPVFKCDECGKIPPCDKERKMAYCERCESCYCGGCGTGHEVPCVACGVDCSDRCRECLDIGEDFEPPCRCILCQHPFCWMCIDSPRCGFNCVACEEFVCTSCYVSMNYNIDVCDSCGVQFCLHCADLNLGHCRRCENAGDCYACRRAACRCPLATRLRHGCCCVGDGCCIACALQAHARVYDHRRLHVQFAKLKTTRHKAKRAALDPETLLVQMMLQLPRKVYGKVVGFLI